nr:PREDICTED: V-set and immunoglobulin domain-containing protein 2 [Lepisosteus oculatus]
MAPFLNLMTIWILPVYFEGALSRQAVLVDSPIYIKMGDSVTLPCKYSTTPARGFTLEWRFAAPGSDAVQAERVLYFDGTLYQVTSWGGRMQLLHSPPTGGTASIRIVDIRPSDTGLYICEITNPSDWSGSGTGLINLTVLMPPSTPVCKLNGNPSVGQDITLTCKATQGLPQPIYTWTKEKLQRLLPASSMVQDQRTGTLFLQNLSSPFSGTYTCQASNELGQASCRVNVSVSYTSTAGVIAGAIMGTFLILLIFGAVGVYFLWYRKKKSKNPQTGNEIREDDTAPAFYAPRQKHEDTSSQLLNHHTERHETSSLSSPKLSGFV